MPSQVIPLLIWLHNLLSLSFLIAVLAAIWQLVAAVVGWRSPYRGRRLRRMAGLLGITVLLPLVQIGLWRGLIRPSMANKLNADIAAARLQQDADTSVVRVGDQAPVFSAADLKGDTFDLAQAQGKIVVMNFFATWCGPCLIELPQLNSLSQTYAEDDRIEFIAIGREETATTLRDFQSKHAVQLRTLPDPDRQIYSQYAQAIIPRTYLIDQQGIIVATNLGYDPHELEELSEQIKVLLGQ